MARSLKEIEKGLLEEGFSEKEAKEEAKKIRKFEEHAEKNNWKKNS